MIEKVFLLKLVLSFLVAGGYLVSIVAISERVSPKVGGIIAGVPSTILIGTAFITWTEGAHVAHDSLLLIPAMVVVSQIFVLVYLYFCEISRLLAISMAGLVWLAFAWPVRYWLAGISFWTSFGISIAGSLAFGWYFKRFKDGHKAEMLAGFKVQLVRFMAAGTVVALAVLFARVLDPFWAGTITAFPALFATSLYFLNESHGAKFTKAFAKQLPISIIGTTLFVVSLYVSLNRIPTLLAFLVSIGVSLLYATVLLRVKE